MLSPALKPFITSLSELSWYLTYPVPISQLSCLLQTPLSLPDAPQLQPASFGFPYPSLASPLFLTRHARGEFPPGGVPDSPG